jgi:phosphoribosylformylglycinamidine synthase I
MEKAVQGGGAVTKPRVKVLYAPGTNCHFETVDAFRLAGAGAEVCNLTDDLIRGKEKLSDCDLLALPGGFSFGDHMAAGRIEALDLVHRLKDQLDGVRQKRIPIIGICNGFQVLVNTGLLPGDGDRNRSSVFESRWVTLFVQKTNCVWTKGLEGKALTVPVGHGEGRLIMPEKRDGSQTVFRYGAMEGTMAYPDNPNGSPLGRAGICDPTGTVLGLMPHPERAIYEWLGSKDGLCIFETGVKAVK